MVSIPTHEEISARAFQIYVSSGYVAGRDLENWLQAEAELTRELQGGSGGTTKRSEEGRSSQPTSPESGGTKASTAAKAPAKRGVRPKGLSSKTL